MTDALLVVASAVLATYAIAFLHRRSLHADLASPASLYAGLVLLHFAVPGLLLGSGLASHIFLNRDNEAYAVQAILFATLALIAVHLGTQFATTRLAFRNRPGLPKYWSSFRICSVSLVLLAIGWIARIHIVESNAYFQIARTVQGELEGPFYAAIRLFEQFPLHVACILSIRYWRLGAPTTRFWGSALLLVVLGELAYWLPSGRKLETILALLLPIMIRYLVAKRLPSVPIAVSLLTFLFFLFPLIHQYRVAIELGGDTKELLHTATVAAGEIASGSSKVDISGSDVALSRISLLEPLSACVRLLKEGDWDVMLGTSYGGVLLGLIPRFIWPDKPNLHYGTDFGHAAGMVWSSDWLTSISVTFFGEAYLNFGWAGLLPVALLGFIFGLLYCQIRRSSHKETWTLLYAILLPTILYIGGTAALYLGALIKLLPFYYLIGRFMTRQGRKPRHSHLGAPAVQVN